MKARYLVAAVSAAIAGSVLIAVPVLARTGDRSHVSKAAEQKTKVRVMDNFFDPRSVGAAQGGKVVFVWKGSNRHNVRFTKVPDGAGRKGSKTKREGRWSRTFKKAGVYRYVCTLFSGMRGTITVKPPPVDEG
jgi:plastocyanin